MVANREHLKLKVEGMSCGHCTAAVERALKGVEGVRKVKVSLEAKDAQVIARPGVKTDALVQAVRAAGYEASLEQ